MGTGEATGERRAVQAAEAAIANPLLDEVSMKGAQGLLISITGGNDLTLYEVDEAASRIRQEVDEEANIILGATFDTALDGVVRVSVVATGIDHVKIDLPEPIIVSPRAETPALARPTAPRQSPATSQPSVQPSPSPSPAVEPAAPLAAVETHGEVEVRPLPPRAALPDSSELEAEEEEEEEPEDAPFIPPAPEIVRPVKMPEFNDLPPIAQTQILAQRDAAGATPQAGEPSRRKTLLEKLAAFGINRPEDSAPALHARPPLGPNLAPANVATPALADFSRPAARPAATPRPVQGQLDQLGRVAPRPQASDDDQLEIPAFLRRRPHG
jgi:cell division protein FtsZ